MPKRVSNIFISNLSYQNIYKSYLLERRNKCNRKDVILFKLKLEQYIDKIYNDLLNDRYIFSKYKKFYVYEPKKREILSASFRDRIVHTWYVTSFLEPIFVPKFLTTSYACIKERGTHKCALDVKKALYVWNKKYPSGYIIKTDVRKFFANIDRNILFNIINKSVKDKLFLRFTKKILDSSSMYDIIKGVGLPIGNYTSQLFANIYLNEIDQYIKHNLKVKYYFRYMDDSVILCKDKEEAKYVLACVKSFYNDILNLELNSKTQIFKLSQGVNFCGYRIYSNTIKIRLSGKKRLKKKMKYLQYALKNNILNEKEAKLKIMGHIGYIKIADVDGLVNNIF